MFCSSPKAFICKVTTHFDQGGVSKTSFEMLCVTYDIWDQTQIRLKKKLWQTLGIITSVTLRIVHSGFCSHFLVLFPSIFLEECDKESFCLTYWIVSKVFYLVSRADSRCSHTLCVWTGHSGAFWEKKARIFLWELHIFAKTVKLPYRNCFTRAAVFFFTQLNISWNPSLFRLVLHIHLVFTAHPAHWTPESIK